MSRWIKIFSKPESKMRLFCIPYAGRGASMYNSWEPFIPDQIELCAIQLPGREERFSEGRIEKFEILIHELIQEIIPYLDKPYAIFGHSLGAIIGYELTNALAMKHRMKPLCLFVSASFPPNQIKNNNFNKLNKIEFLNKIIKYNGIPDEILLNKEFLDLFLPILRSDTEIYESYNSYNINPPKIICPLFSFGGNCDPLISQSSLYDWSNFTKSSYRAEFFKGDHFFINEMYNKKILIGIIVNEMTYLF